MNQPDRKPSAELIAELQALQEAGDEIRARMNDTMADLEANAAQLNAATERVVESAEPWRPS